MQASSESLSSLIQSIYKTSGMLDQAATILGSATGWSDRIGQSFAYEMSEAGKALGKATQELDAINARLNKLLQLTDEYEGF